jgi:Protein of unknown function (DUF4238)
VNQPINQHWVSKFYLRGFATPETRELDNPQVWAFSKEESNCDVVLTNVKNICGKRYLYSPRDEAGQRTRALESELSSLESTMAEVWPALANGVVNLQNETLRKGVALFIATLCLRHPNSLELVSRTHQEIVAAFENAPKDPNGVPSIDTIFFEGREWPFDGSDWHSYCHWDDNDRHRFFAAQIKAHAAYLARMFMKKRWSVIRAQGPLFVTSDNPVCKDHLTKANYGFGTEGTIVTFPLGPSQILCMDDMHSEPAGQYYQLRDNDAGPINLMTFRNAMRFIISQRPIDEALAEIVRWGDAFERSALTSSGGV